jgi:hypothetical protein
MSAISSRKGLNLVQTLFVNIIYKIRFLWAI